MFAVVCRVNDFFLNSWCAFIATDHRCIRMEIGSFMVSVHCTLSPCPPAQLFRTAKGVHLFPLNMPSVTCMRSRCTSNKISRFCPATRRWERDADIIFLDHSAMGFPHQCSALSRPLSPAVRQLAPDRGLFIIDVKIHDGGPLSRPHLHILPSGLEPSTNSLETLQALHIASHHLKYKKRRVVFPCGIVYGLGVLALSSGASVRHQDSKGPSHRSTFTFRPRPYLTTFFHQNTKHPCITRRW